jgi:two-component system cell cycle response regulator DivK
MTYILLVEDNQAHAELIMRTLEAADYQVRHCLYGLEATEIARAEPPSLILMDYNLPDIDGRNAIILLRKYLGGINAPPIVAVTANTGDFDIQFSKLIGCAAFVSKPFLPDELLKLVNTLLMPTEADK